MVDSDEEYNQLSNANNQSGLPNRKNRDKFYRERDEMSNSNSNNYNRDRRDWGNDNRNNNPPWKNIRNNSNNYPRKYQTSPRYESSPPPSKRNKKDWTESLQDQKQSFDMPDYPTQPPFYSFKQFLQQQDDSISDEEAIKRYNEYKLEFKRTQINNFFLEHKEEDWFKQRYHPDENIRRRNEQNRFILNRMEVFLDLMNNGWLNDVSVEVDCSKELTRYLDAFVVKLEGGTDKDLKKVLSNKESSDPINLSPKSDEKKDDGTEIETKNNGNSSHKSKSKRDYLEDYSLDEENNEQFQDELVDIYETNQIIRNNLPNVSKEETTSEEKQMELELLDECFFSHLKLDSTTGALYLNLAQKANKTNNEDHVHFYTKIAKLINFYYYERGFMSKIIRIDALVYNHHEKETVSTYVNLVFKKPPQTSLLTREQLSNEDEMSSYVITVHKGVA